MHGPRVPSIPRFQYHLSSRSNTHYGWITADEEKVDRIGDLNGFYRALGYTEEAGRRGLLPDEFIWFEYIKDHCSSSESQLQAKIIEYLNTHSPAFREKFGHQCEGWLNVLTA